MEQVHIIRARETPEMVSARYGIPVCILMKENLTDSTTLRWTPGRRIIIPSYAKEQADLYLVKSGDTAYSIARDHGVAMYDLLKCNGFAHARQIQPGQALTIPAHMRIYTVGATDTLAAIAEKFAVDAEEIKRVNKIGEEVYRGMQLYIPDN